MDQIQFERVTDKTIRFVPHKPTKTLSIMDAGIGITEADLMEKKPEDATGNKFRNFLPDDLLFLILSKLPLKSLKKFACVCKFWAGLFENPHFMNIFRNNLISNHCSYNEDRSLFLNMHNCSKSELFTLSGERFQDRVKLDWPNPFQEDDPYFLICGPTSINGTLCLVRKNKEAVLWNSTTGECNVIPPSPVEFLPVDITVLMPPSGWEYVPLHERTTFVRCVIFGYDPIRDDLKVIKNIQPCTDTGSPIGDPLWEIYSLKSNSWWTLDDDEFLIDSLQYSNFLYLDGMSHWVGYEDYSDSEKYLISFDFSREVFLRTLMPIPSEEYHIFYLRRFLVSLNGSIALISNYDCATTVYISVLAQVGVEESWTKLYILESLPCIESPIGIGKKGDIFFRRKDGEFVMFDLSTHVIMELGVKIRTRDIGTWERCKIILYN